jgi:hypothetical protein
MDATGTLRANGWPSAELIDTASWRFPRAQAKLEHERNWLSRWRDGSGQRTILEMRTQCNATMTLRNNATHLQMPLLLTGTIHDRKSPLREQRTHSAVVVSSLLWTPISSKTSSPESGPG